MFDDHHLWSLSRRTVDDARHLVVFLGASRMALAYSPRAFAEAAPALRGLQLSVSNHLPLGALADLADDEAFRGVAVLDIIEPDVADALFLSDVDAYVEASRALWRAPDALANRYLASLAQSQLAVLAVGGRRIVTSLIGRRRWPAPQWVAIDRQRASHGDYSLATPAQLAARARRRVEALPAAPPPSDWLAILARDLEPLVARIQARDGRVVVVRMPVSGALAATIDQRYPRARYWDAFTARTAATTIHFQDEPAMRALTCPDEMHLDQRDQAAFTRALTEAMRRRGALDGPPTRPVPKVTCGCGARPPARRAVRSA